MIIDNVNLNHLRVFESVYRTKSMTTSALELHLTQSGVSQHIKSLEDVLGITLFDRIKQRLVPTTPASQLYKKCSEAFNGIEQGLSEIKGGDKQLTGTVSIGMPIEFGNNIVTPMLAKFCKQYPLVKFQLRYGFATEMNDGILSGNLDFAFVDAFGVDKRITTEEVYDEVLYLCATQECVKRFGAVQKTKKYFESLEYVDYQPGEPVCRLWFDHHLGNKNLHINTRAVVMDVQGVARLIIAGLAAGVLPGHLVSKLEKEGHKLYRFSGTGKPLKNAISVAFLKDRTHSLTATAVQSFLIQGIQGKTERSDE